MKVIKKILGFISLALIGGGIIVFSWEYFRNKQMFAILMANSVVRGSLPIIQRMLFALIAIIAGLLCFVLYLKAGTSVRRSEREKREAIKQAEKEKEEMTKQLKKEAEEAKAEAEKAKKENEEMRLTFLRKENAEEENGQE